MMIVLFLLWKFVIVLFVIDFFVVSDSWFEMFFCGEWKIFDKSCCGCEFFIVNGVYDFFGEYEVVMDIVLFFWVVLGILGLCFCIGLLYLYWVLEVWYGE